MRAPSVVRALRVLPALVLLSLALAAPAIAATREFYFEPLGSDRGLAQSTVGALAQDTRGIVWVGTQGGLHRFDGQRYRVIRHDPRDPRSLPDNFVTALAVDGEALWVGTYSQYVAKLDLHTGAIRRHGASAPDRRPDRQVLALLAERDAVWVGTVAGLDRLDPATGKRQRVLDLQRPHRTGAPPQRLLRDRRGRLWFATGEGLFQVGAGGPRRIGDDRAAHTVLEDRAGQLWIGAESGLERLDGGRRVPVWSNGPGAPTQVRALAEAPDGRLWLSVFPDGLRRYASSGGAVDVVREDRALPGSLPENSINALLVDRGGILWTGGQYRGAAVADPRGSRFPLITGTAAAVGGAAADDSIRAVTGTPGALWLATDGDRLLRYDLATGRFESMPALGRVAGFERAPGGRLWLATATGLVELDPATSALRRPPGTWPVLRAIAGDARGDLWLGTSGAGGLRYSPRDGRITPYPAGPQGLSHPNVHAVLADRRGRVWFGTGDGLDLLEPRSGRLRHFRQVVDQPDSLPSNVVRAVFEDARGRVWVGTHAGLSEVIEDPRGGITFRHPLDAALPEHRALTIFSLREGPRGTLWAGTDAGLLRYRPEPAQARLFGVGDGLQDLEFNGGAAGVLDDGRLAFGGVRGLNLVDPARAADDAFAGPLALLSVRIDGQAPRDAWGVDRLDLPAGSELLRLQIGMLDFAPALRPRYRYRLDGFDDAWIDNGPQGEITYTHLPPGRYVLRAQGTDRSGAWSPRELRLAVNVATPLWRHPIVLILLAALLLGPAAMAVWQAVQRRRREREHLRVLHEREERLKLALWASGEQFWDYDLVRGILQRTQTSDPTSAEPELGIVEASESDHRIHPDDIERVREQLRRYLRGEAPQFESQHRIVGPDGGWLWVRARGRVVERGPDGRALRLAGTARDITATRRAERDRRVASEVLRSMAEAVAVFDDDFRFVSVNPAFTRMTGYVEQEVVGQSTSLIDSRQHDEGVYRHMRDDLRKAGRWSGELWQRRKDGSEFLCWLQASVVLDSAGQRGNWVAVLSDITDQKRAEQELRYLANYDTLTGLPNRTLLGERLSRAILRARRQDTRLGLLFLDLDRFKDINDSLGHAAGDAILRATAARLQHTVGGQHTVARLGGDEFTIVLEHLESIEEAEDVARQLLAAFQAPLDAGELRDVIVTPSIGIAVFPDHAQTPSDLLKHADTAMYQAKAVGRRTYMRYAGSMDAEIRRRATLSAALRKVLDRQELSLVYQPKMAVADGRMIGVEALLRWNSSEFGPVSPAQFIPLAEESGLILEIGEWALRQACSQLKAWRDGGLDIGIAVNVSALQLLRGNLPEVIEQTLHATGLPAHCLEIELTESVVMAEATWSALHAIRSLGVQTAIDDFGTGYSSLAYLKRLPINTLKIDKEFIGDLTRDPDDEAITSAVIAMGHSLGLQVVAEGVETADQLEFLRRHGCDVIQGYWLARPMPPEACEAFLRERTPVRDVADEAP
ncbi:EAL domain-containing protein [Lysobacter humi (ex Lee et al. 2017)]